VKACTHELSVANSRCYDCVEEEIAFKEGVAERWFKNATEARAERDRYRKALEDALEIIRSVNDPTQASAGLRQIVEAALRPDGEVGG